MCTQHVLNEQHQNRKIHPYVENTPFMHIWHHFIYPYLASFQTTNEKASLSNSLSIRGFPVAIKAILKVYVMHCITNTGPSRFFIFTSRVSSWGHKNGPVCVCVCVCPCVNTLKPELGRGDNYRFFKNFRKWKWHHPHLILVWETFRKMYETRF